MGEQPEGAPNYHPAPYCSLKQCAIPALWRELSLEFLHGTAKRYGRSCESSFMGFVVGILKQPLLLPTEPFICWATMSPSERTTWPANRPATAIVLRIGWLQVRPQLCTQCDHHLERDPEPGTLSPTSTSICSKLGGKVFFSRGWRMEPVTVCHGLGLRRFRSRHSSFELYMYKPVPTAELQACGSFD